MGKPNQILKAGENIDNETLALVFERITKIVDPKIKKILTLDIDKKFRQVITYQVETGGKKVRASLVVLACLACGGKIEDVVYPAAGVEILHNNTLMIDDIIDHSYWRRRKKTFWNKFGTSITQCVNFVYSASVFQACLRSNKPDLVNQKIAKVMKMVLQGEILDILFEQSGREEERYIRNNRFEKVAMDDYIDMISKKSASLIKTAVEVGSICANCSEKEEQALNNYGINLGIAFQIRDDILDVYGEEEKFGKKIGQDIRERKLGNILTLYTLRESSQENKKQLLNILRKDKITQGDVNKALQVIKSTNAKERANKLADKYIQEAKENLKVLSQNQYTEMLSQVADFAVRREK